MLEYEAKEIQYSDKGFDEVDTNFMGIGSSYRKYGSPFFSKSQMHKYLKEGCTGLVQTPLPTLPTPALPIPMIELKAIVLAMRSGLAFQV